MSRRASLALLGFLAAASWMLTAIALAATWVAGRFFAGILGWA
ncbi:hypothetical protein [Falsiroseomonas sp.]